MKRSIHIGIEGLQRTIRRDFRPRRSSKLSDRRHVSGVEHGIVVIDGLPQRYMTINRSVMEHEDRIEPAVAQIGEVTHGVETSDCDVDLVVNVFDRAPTTRRRTH